MNHEIKYKIYIDTSVISYLFQNDAPEKMADTLEFWNDAKNGLFSVCVSAAVIEEINKCEPEKRKILVIVVKRIDAMLLCNFGLVNQHSLSLGLRPRQLPRRGSELRRASNWRR